MLIQETIVVHAFRDKYDIYIGRPRRGERWAWGNPFLIGKDGGRYKVIQLFDEWLLTSPDPRAVWMRENIYTLKGKRLGCFCAPHPCHGDVLRVAADKC